MYQVALITIGKQNPQLLREIFVKAHQALRLTTPGTAERSRALFAVAEVAEAMYAAGL